MRFTRTCRLFVLTGRFALCAFAGDIVADSIADLRGDHCVSQSSQDSQHGKVPCGHCSCDVHNGNVIISTLCVDVVGASATSIFLPIAGQSGPDGLPTAIDHPPQLA
jgi:hypothetical protein